MTEAEARKIGGKYGAIYSAFLCLIILILVFLFLLGEDNQRVLKNIKGSIQSAEDFFTSPYWWLSFFTISFFVFLIVIGYCNGEKAGVNIIIKGTNYLRTGWWSMYKTICISSLLGSIVLILFLSLSFILLRIDEYNFGRDEYDIFGYLIIIGVVLFASISVIGLLLSIWGFWLGNKIDNERIKHLTTEDQESNYSE